MGSDFGNSEQNLCGANSVNNQLIFNGTNGNLNNNNRINTNRVRVSLEFDHNEAGSSGCVPSSEWYKYYRIARKNKKKKAAHIKFRLRCFDNLNEIRDSVNSMEYQPEMSQAFVLITTTPFLRLVECIVYAFSHYTDDNCGVVTDKDDFLALRPVIADFADRKCHYTVHPDKFYFQHYSKGVEFLGYRLKYGLILPSKRLMHNFKWKVTTAIRKADGNRFYMLANKDRFMSVVNSCCGLLKHTASYNYRKRELSRLKDSAWVEVFDFDEARWLKVTIKKGYRKSDYYKHIAKRRKIEIFKPLKLQAA